jgi:FkbM family methyltransferase
LEKLLGWHGLMIEAEPDNFRQARDKHRDVVLVPGCLSITTKPKLSGFQFGIHVYSKIDEKNVFNDTVQVQCVPLYSILLAMNVTTVDLFSLDIEGHELAVLKTIPFDKIDIKVSNFVF